MDDYSREVEQMSDALMEAQIAIYPIDPAGLTGAAFRPLLNRYGAQSSLREMAERTGGKAFINRNDLDLGIRSSIDDVPVITPLRTPRRTRHGTARCERLRSRPRVRA